jgi:AraC-like DNA-binding protein
MSIADMAVAAPHARLAGLVDRYVGYRFEGFPSGTHLALPSYNVTIAVSLAAPIRIAVDGRASDHMAFASGLDTRPAVISHDGIQHGLQVGFTPAGARSLLGVPAAALAGEFVDLDQLLGRPSGELAEQMATAPTWAHRFQILDRILCRRAGHLPPARDYLAHAWHRIVSSIGTTRIGDLAADTGFSHRYLRKQFIAEYGLTPKSVARVVRFERSRRLLQHRAPPPLATVAAVCGYYDQAHLTRDWNDLAGCPPSAWLATEDLPLTEIPQPNHSHHT